MRVTGLVLAGGFSRRMGADKSAIVLPEGRTLLQRQVDVMHRAGIDDVLVSRRRDQAPALAGARTVFDIAPDSGPLAGIAAGLATIRDGVLLVLAVDMPFVSTAVLRTMISLASSGCGVVPHRGNGIECLIGVYPRLLASLAARRVASRQLRVREFAALAESSGHAMRWEIPERFVLEFRNWNTPADVKASDVLV